MSGYTNRIFSALISCMVIAALSSCSTPKHNVIVMSDLETSNAGTLGMSIPELTIVPDDELMINVTADVPQAAAIYNLPLNVNVPRSDLKTGVSMERIHTYRVDKQGNINFPVLGKLHVAGMTTTALADELVKRISADVENPVVVVDLLNFKVKVTGDVKTPGVIESDKQHISVLDALAAAGDINLQGRRDNVLIIRENNGETTYHRIDLTNSKTWTPEYFYLKQNDVVYVEPAPARIDELTYNERRSFSVSLASIIVSSASVLTSLVIALTK